MFPQQGLLLQDHRSFLGFVKLTNQSIDDALNLGATYRLQSDGKAEIFTEDSGSFDQVPGEWKVSGSAADYAARWDRLSGDSPTVVGTAEGLWGTLTTGIQLSIGASKHSVFRFRIRRVSDSLIMADATITMDTTA